MQLHQETALCRPAKPIYSAAFAASPSFPSRRRIPGQPRQIAGNDQLGSLAFSHALQGFSDSKTRPLVRGRSRSITRLSATSLCTLSIAWASLRHWYFGLAAPRPHGWPSFALGFRDGSRFKLPLPEWLRFDLQRARSPHAFRRPASVLHGDLYIAGRMFFSSTRFTLIPTCPRLHQWPQLVLTMSREVRVDPVQFTHNISRWWRSGSQSPVWGWLFHIQI